MTYKLTKRESEIVNLILQGKSNKQIAKELYIAQSTAKNAICNILDKTGSESRAELIVKLSAGNIYFTQVRCMDCRFCSTQYFNEYSGCGPFSSGVCGYDLTNPKIVDESAFRLCSNYNRTVKHYSL
jgi:LuxR family transcriptional regulator of spore coat protein